MKITAVDNSQTSFNGFISSDLARVIEKETQAVVSQKMRAANRSGHVLQKSELEKIKQISDFYDNLAEYMGRLQRDTYLAAKPAGDGTYRLTIGNNLLNSSLDLIGGSRPDGKVYSSFLGVPSPELTAKKPNLAEKFWGVTFGVKKGQKETFVNQLFKMFDVLKDIDPKQIDNALFEQSKGDGLIGRIIKVLNDLSKKKSSLNAMSERRDRIRVYNAVNRMFGSSDSIPQRPYMVDLKSTLSEKFVNIRSGFSKLKTYISTSRENSKNLRNMQ